MRGFISNNIKLLPKLYNCYVGFKRNKTITVKISNKYQYQTLLKMKN